MGVWGSGLLQSDDDADIAADLERIFGFPLCPSFSSLSTSPSPPAFNRALTAEKLDTDNLLSSTFAKILTPTFVPLSAHHKRERIAVVLGMLAMQTGARLSSKHMRALRMLRWTLPTIEQQVQLVAALDGYVNDGITPWVSGSKTFAETAQARGTDETKKCELGDEFWYSGLGHSADSPPTSDMQSTSCLSCGEEEENLFCCMRCKTARYCSKTCQKQDWSDHKIVCDFRDKIRSCPIPMNTEGRLTEARQGVIEDQGNDGNDQ
ncbi:hypothetical protein E0Z10_g8867 [Xylaria hypoxylon]|uniref:MYND-type domain-containing protein n=1 Tax=Xylaria hypoxylon TaxID=37992 RepID=A0A4Z0YQP5_9PEZI|nr:hypothetical protein E0Z10_g8867 [Xylaria hypoxylon]